MAVNTSAITETYTTFFDSITTNLNTLYDDKKIDAETYSGLLSVATKDLLQTTISVVQNQETIDNDYAIKLREMAIAEENSAMQLSNIQSEIDYRLKQKDLITSQIIGSGYDNSVKEQQVQESIHKVAIAAQQIDIAERSIVINETELDDKLVTSAKQRSLLDKDLDIKERSAIMQETELQDKLETSVKQRLVIDKEVLKADYELNTLLTDQHIANVKQLDVLNKEIDVKERAIVLQESELDDKLSTSAKQREVLEIERLSKIYEKDFILVDQHNTNLSQIESIEKDIEIKERSTILQETEVGDKLSTSAKQRLLLDSELVTATKQQTLLDKDLDVKERAVIIQESELYDKLATANLQRNLINEEISTSQTQQDILAIEKSMKDYEKTVLQPDGHASNQKQLEVFETEIAVKEKSVLLQEKEVDDRILTSIKQRTTIDAQLTEIEDSIIRANRALDSELDTAEKQRLILVQEEELKKQQGYSEELSQKALAAKTKDEYGILISTTGDSCPIVDNTTRHYNEVQKMKNDVKTSEAQTATVKMQAEVYSAEAYGKECELTTKYGAELDYVNSDGRKVFFIPTVLTDNDATALFSSFKPKSEYEASMLKAYHDAKISENTAKGYQADTYYKQYRSLQELFFSLGNAGIGDDTDYTADDNDHADSIYGRVVLGMQNAMNKQSAVWDDASGCTVQLTTRTVDQSDCIS